jgi:sugar lactone lactonase YvrE
MMTKQTKPSLPQLARRACALALALGVAACGGGGGGGGGGGAPATVAAPVGLSAIAGNIGGRFVLDGKGGDARFDTIGDFAGDAAGGFYVVDAAYGQTGAVRKVDKDGVVTTLTNAAPGHVDGDRAHARVEGVRSVSVAPDGKVYLLDGGAQGVHVRLLGADGAIRTLATLERDLAGAGRIAAASGGVVYIAAPGALARMAADGRVALVQGSAYGGGNDYLRNDIALAPNGDLYTVSGGSIDRVTPDGKVSALVRRSPLSDGSDGALAEVGVVEVLSLTVRANGDILLLDSGRALGGSDYKLRQISGGRITTLFTEHSRAGYPFQRNLGDKLLRLAADGTMLIASNGMLNRVGAAGALAPLAGLADDNEGYGVDGRGAAARYFAPGMLGADGAGNVYSIEGTGGVVQAIFAPSSLVLRKTAPDGTVSTLAKSDAGAPSGIAVSRDGKVYVSLQPAGTGQQRWLGGAVYQVLDGQRLVLLAGVPEAAASEPRQRDGVGAAARFNHPALAGIDADGNLFLRDGDGFRKIDAKAAVSTIAALPAGLNAAPDGNVYTADAKHGVVYRTTPAGARSVVAGVLDQHGTILGALPGQLDHPSSIVATGPGSFAVASGAAIVRLVLP